MKDIMDTSSDSGKIRGGLVGASRMASLAAFVLVAAVAHRPASAEYGVFWGDVHGHTSHSDGEGSL